MPRSSSLLALAACAPLAVPTFASAAPSEPAIVGPAYIADINVLPRLGLAVRDGYAPTAVRVPKVARLIADDLPGSPGDGPYGLRQLPSGDVLLAGRSGWDFIGPDTAHLGPGELRDDLSGRFGIRTWRYTSDGGVVGDSGLNEGEIIGLGPGLENRWSTPLQVLATEPVPPRGPFGLAGGDRVYAFGGTAAIIDGITGATLAAIDPLGEGELPRDGVGAADGSARLVTLRAESTGRILTKRVTVHRFDVTGHRAWSAVVADAQGPLGLEASAPSTDPGGVTYIGIATSNGISRWDGRVVAIGADGAIRWDSPVGGMPSRPAIDRSGNVWVATTLGEAVAIAPDGSVAFRRRVAPAKSAGTVAANGDRVLVIFGQVTARLAARPATAGLPAAIALAPAGRLFRMPVRCVAPASGVSRPKTCLYRIDAGAPLRIDAPATGTADIVIRPVAPIPVGTSGGRPVVLRPDRRSVPVLPGINLVRLTGFGNQLSQCRAGAACTVRPGRYRVTVTLRAGGPARTVTRIFRVLPGPGLMVDP